MPLDFPNSPAVNDTWTASNGVTYVWNGTMWATQSSGAGGPFLPLAGGTMTGALALAADPATNPQAANKHYVDQSINLAGNYLGTWQVAANTPNINAGGSVSNANYVAVTANPATPETAPVGVPGIAGMTVANGDRVIWAAGLGVWQILRNAAVTLAAGDARYVALAGSTMTGALNLAGDSTAPTPAAGDNDTSIANTQFVQTAVAPSTRNIGRNLLHNPLFNVAQRGAGPWTTGSYTADRWLIINVTDTVSVSVVQATDADRAAIGDEGIGGTIQNVFTGNAAAGAFNHFRQHIEGTRRLGGKNVTLSFWAKAASGTPKLGVNAYQTFGTGGSPSASVYALATGLSVTLSTTWARYNLTIALPSTAGKTFGTNSDDYTMIQFWYSSGATNNATAGNIGVQSGTIQLWGVQLEIGTIATPLDKPYDQGADLRNCQRFYQVGQLVYQVGNQLAGNVHQMTLGLPTTMRANPAIVITNNSNANLSSFTLGALNASVVFTNSTVTANGNINVNVQFTASADL